MEPKDSLSCCQGPLLTPCPETHESSQHPHTLRPQYPTPCVAFSYKRDLKARGQTAPSTQVEGPPHLGYPPCKPPAVFGSTWKRIHSYCNWWWWWQNQWRSLVTQWRNSILHKRRGIFYATERYHSFQEELCYEIHNNNFNKKTVCTDVGYNKQRNLYSWNFHKFNLGYQ